MSIQSLVLSSSSAALQNVLDLDPDGAFNGQGSASTAADENAGAFNGEWDTGANNGLQNIGAFNGVFDDGSSNGNDNLGAFNGSFNSSADNGNGNIGTFNGNFNGNTVLVGNGTTTNDLVFGEGSVDVASGEEPAETLHGDDGTGGMTFNIVTGDVDSLLGTAIGGNDKLLGGNNATVGVVVNTLVGDADSTAGHAWGGDDTLIGGDSTGSGGVQNALVGDAVQLVDNSVGGQDNLVGGSNFDSGFVQNAEFGDALTIGDSARGARDSLVAGDNHGSGFVQNALFGTAIWMNGHSRGGHDTLSGGDNFGTGWVQDAFFGDAGLMSDFASGGSNALVGGANRDSGSMQEALFGDAAIMTDDARGGRNDLHGGSNFGDGSLDNVLIGDAGLMEGHASAQGNLLRGGDSLGGGDVINVLVGDAMTLGDFAIGGDNVLVAGQAFGASSTVENFLWGDAVATSATATVGNDTFIFGDHSGLNNFIMDFHTGDSMEFDLDGGFGFNDLQISQLGNSSEISIDGVDVFLVGYTSAVLAGAISFITGVPTGLAPQPIADDLNGDAQSDILWRNTNGTLAAWLMDRGSVMSSGFITSGGVVVTPGPTWSVAGMSDFNGDGNADVLWRNTDGTLADWSMNGTTIVSSGVLNFHGLVVKPDASWSVVGTDDLDSDSRADILWRNTNGTIVDWSMNGSSIASSSVVSFAGTAVDVGAPWSVAGAGDFNGDNKRDVLWRSTSGEVVVWQMNGGVIGDSSHVTYSGVAVKPDASWSVAGVGDFDGDGNSDMLWRNTNGSLAEWQMNGSTIASSDRITFAGIAVTPDATWHVVEISDFNGDGSSDVLWRNDNGAMAQWLMNGNEIMQSVTPNYGGTAVSPDASWKPTSFS